MLQLEPGRLRGIGVGFKLDDKAGILITKITIEAVLTAKQIERLAVYSHVPSAIEVTLSPIQASLPQVSLPNVDRQTGEITEV